MRDVEDAPMRDTEGALKTASPPSGASEAARRRICVVLNPGSGAPPDEPREAMIERVLRDRVAECALRVAGPDDDLGAIAREAADDGFDVVAAAGGDGTINAVASALRGRGAALGVVPLGTFNYIARGLGVPEDPERATALLADGGLRRMDAAEVNGRLFLNNASLGAYPRILARREEIYRRWGRSRIAANWSVVDALVEAATPMTVTLSTEDGRRRVRTPLIFVARSAFQLGRFALEGERIVRAGRMAVFVAPEAGRAGMVWRAARLATGALRRGRDFTLLGTDALTVESAASGRLVARDGERERIAGPLRFRMRRGFLRVVTP
jgi:diacylglycerol kinase family enzyme